MAMAQFDASLPATSSSSSAMGASRAEIQMLLSQFDSMINQLHDYPAKDIINSLTIMAEKVQFAGEIASFLETKLYRVPPNYKLPIFYLLDSILKNVGGPYPALFGRNIIPLFLSCIKQVSQRDLQRFVHVLNTWTNVRLFSSDALAQMRAAANRAQQSADPAIRNQPVSFAPSANPRATATSTASASASASAAAISSRHTPAGSLAGDMELRSLLTKLQNEMGIHPTQHMSLEEVRTDNPAYYKQLLEYQAQQQGAAATSTTTSSLQQPGMPPSSVLSASTSGPAVAASASSSVLGSAPPSVLPTPTVVPPARESVRDPRESRRRGRGADKKNGGAGALPNKRRGRAAGLPASSNSMPPNQRVAGPQAAATGPVLRIMEAGGGVAPSSVGVLEPSGGVLPVAPGPGVSGAAGAPGASKSANVAHLMQLLKRKKRNSPPKLSIMDQQEQQEIVNEPSGTFAASATVSPSGPPPASSLSGGTKRAAPDAAAVMSILKKLKGINQRNARGTSNSSSSTTTSHTSSTAANLSAPLEKLTIQKERIEANVQMLYAELPLVCSESGLRFKDEAKLHAHYDFLFQYRRAQKEQSKGGVSRCWYPDVELWISDVSRESGVDSMSRSTVFENKQEQEDELEDTLDKSRVPVDDQVTRCRICGESFEKCWDEEEEEWVYKNAIVGQVHDVDATVKHETIFHRYCYDTVLANSKYITEEHLIPVSPGEDDADDADDDGGNANQQAQSNSADETLVKSESTGQGVQHHEVTEDDDDDDDDDDKRVVS